MLSREREVVGRLSLWAVSLPHICWWHSSSAPNPVFLPGFTSAVVLVVVKQPTHTAVINPSSPSGLQRGISLYHFWQHNNFAQPLLYFLLRLYKGDHSVSCLLVLMHLNTSMHLLVALCFPRCHICVLISCWSHNASHIIFMILYRNSAGRSISSRWHHNKLSEHDLPPLIAFIAFNCSIN